MNDLLSSRLYDDETFYPAFFKDLSNARHEVLIESPFITLKKAKLFLPYFHTLTKKGIKTTIITRFPQEHELNLAHQTVESVKLFKDVGIQVYYYGKLHRKIAIIDRNILWEGSLNILSQVYSAELMRRIESKELSEQMINFLSLEQKTRGSV